MALALQPAVVRRRQVELLERRAHRRRRRRRRAAPRSARKSRAIGFKEATESNSTLTSSCQGCLDAQPSLAAELPRSGRSASGAHGRGSPPTRHPRRRRARTGSPRPRPWRRPRGAHADRADAARVGLRHPDRALTLADLARISPDRHPRDDLARGGVHDRDLVGLRGGDPEHPAGERDAARAPPSRARDCPSCDQWRDRATPSCRPR